MTWSYSGVPGNSSLDAVRFLSGQTSTGDPELVQDEEIEWLVTQEGNAWLAAAQVCEALGGRYTGKATSRTVGELSLTYADRGATFTQRAADLRRRAALRSVVPYSGGASVADKEVLTGDADRIQPSFARGMDDRPGTDDEAST